MTTPPPNPNAEHHEPQDPMDPSLDALLDAALAPEAAAEHWSPEARAQTLAAMHEASRTTATPDVAGRIGFGPAGLRLGVGFAAAAVLAIAGAVIAVTLLSDPTTTKTPNAQTMATNNGPSNEAANLVENVNAVEESDALAALDAKFAAELDAWSAAAQGTGLATGFSEDDTTLASVSSDWWNTDPSADAYSTGLDAEALLEELDAFSSSPDLVF